MLSSKFFSIVAMPKIKNKIKLITKLYINFLAAWYLRRFFSIYFYVKKMIRPLWPHPTPGDNDLNKLESTLPENASTQLFLAD